MDPLTASLLGASAVSSLGGSYMANQANQNMNSANMQFQAQQAAAARAQSAQQFSDTLRFNDEQARVAREVQSGWMHEQMGFNAAEAQKSRDFSQWMSSSAYQRSMADMKAAGLNPILAYQQGGAATPSSPSASGGVPSAAQASGHGTGSHGAGSVSMIPSRNVLENVFSSAFEAAKISPAVDKLRAEAAGQEAVNKRTEAETRTEKAREANVRKDTETKERNTAVAEGARSRVRGGLHGPFGTGVSGDADLAYYGQKALDVGSSVGSWIKQNAQSAWSSAKEFWNSAGDPERMYVSPNRSGD